MKIGKKLSFSNGLMAVSVIVVAVILSRITASIDEDFEALSERTLQVTRLLENIRFAGLRIVSSTNEHMLISVLRQADIGEATRESGKQQETEEENLIDEGAKLLTETTSHYGNFVKTYFPGESKSLATIKVLNNELIMGSRDLISLIKDKIEPNDIIEQKEQFESIEQKFLNALESSLARETEVFRKAKKDIEDTIDAVISSIWIGLIGTAAYVLIFGGMVARSITGPILRLSSAVKNVAAGNLSTRVQLDSKDEIGELASSFNQMVSDLQTNITRREQAEGELKSLNSDLEHRVEERTIKLNQAQNDLVRQERLAVLGRLSATVSHELRNPLGTIRTSMITITDNTGDMDLGIEGAVGRIERNINRCDAIISELLDYARDTRPNLELTDLGTWLNETLDEQNIPPDISLVRNLTCDIVANVDPEWMRRVIINTLDNAVHAVSDHTDGETKTITVTTRNTGSRVEILVSDSGPGIPDDELGKIFEPLYSTKSYGVGLGLPVVKKIIEEHGGGVNIASTVGQGAQVTLWLPLPEKTPEQGENGTS